MVIEQTIIDNAFKILEIISIIGGGGLVVFRLGRAMATFETVGRAQGQEIRELKDSVKELGKIVVNQALQNQRLDQIGQQQALLAKQLDELRHGEGFIYPLSTHFAPKSGT